MKEIITYKQRSGVTTKDILRTINDKDQRWLKTVMLGYLCLEGIEPRPLFKQWFNAANLALPKQPMVGNQHNSPKTFAEGILAKLEQAPNRRDLSPKQCSGIEELTKMMNQIYEIPYIVFIEKGKEKLVTTAFDEFFKNTHAK
jgi:hypothetical protein